MSLRLVRLYRADNGIWHYEIERDGDIRWSSFRTRSEEKARRKYAELEALLQKAQGEDSTP